MSEYTINKIEYDGNIYNLQDANAGPGTVTSIGISNATNGGLSVSDSPITTSGSITVGHSNILNSAQTTQAVYPITIDKNGHISAYGTAVTIPDISGKVNITEINDGITSSIVRTNDYLKITANDNSYSTGISIGPEEIFLNTNTGDTGWIDDPSLYLCGSDNTFNFSGGNIIFWPYSEGSEYYYEITGNLQSSNRTITLPDKAGTVALTSDILQSDWNQTTSTAKDYIKNKPTSMTPSSHSHGNITNDGDITATAPEIGSGDRLVINDDSASKITNGPAFDGTTTKTALTPKGTWENFVKKDGSYGDPPYSYSVYGLGSTATQIPVYYTTNNITEADQVTTKGYVDNAISALPTPMLFKGSVGTGGTITTLPTATTSNEGFTYKVITALSTPVTAKVGDTVISNGSSWVVIPSGDEPAGTVTSVGLSNATNGGLSISGSPITSSGTISIGHSNILTSAQTTQAVYPIKIDKNGHIREYGTAVSIPTKVSDLTNDSGFITGYTETDPIFAASAAHGITSSDITNWNGKQAALVSGTNIKTINNQSLLGSGNIAVSTTAAQIIRWTESA